MKSFKSVSIIIIVLLLGISCVQLLGCSAPAGITDPGALNLSNAPGTTDTTGHDPSETYSLPDPNECTRNTAEINHECLDCHQSHLDY